MPNKPHQKIKHTNKYEEGINDKESRDSCCKTIGRLWGELKEVPWGQSKNISVLVHS